MNLKPVFCALLPAILAFSASAQDKIFQSNGNVIKARVVTVNEDNIVYKLWSHPDGPEYTIRRDEVDKIKYEGGKQEWFAPNRSEKDNYRSQPREPHGRDEWRRERMARNKMQFGRSIIAFAPIQITEQGVGFAVNYEHGIDKDGIVSFNLPLVATFSVHNQNEYDYYGNPVSNNRPEDGMVYFCPGIKFYPSGMFGKCKFAIGPSLVIGAGQQSTDLGYVTTMPTSSYAYPTYGTYDKFVLGAMLTSSLNISPTKHFYMGIDYSFGFTYLNQLNGVNQGMTGLEQFAFKLGYRL